MSGVGQMIRRPSTRGNPLLSQVPPGNTIYDTHNGTATQNVRET